MLVRHEKIPLLLMINFIAQNMSSGILAASNGISNYFSNQNMVHEDYHKTHRNTILLLFACLLFFFFLPSRCWIVTAL